MPLGAVLKGKPGETFDHLRLQNFHQKVIVNNWNLKKYHIFD